MMAPTAPTDHIIAEKRTFLKKKAISAKDLPPEQKRIVDAGTRYPVKKYSESINFHWLVELADGPWLVFDGPGEHSHWNLSWQQDTDEVETVKPPDVTSNADKDSPVGASLMPNMPFSTRITKHITYGEFALYQEARRFHYPHQCKTAYLLARFMEQCRAHFGGNPVRLTSGFRPYAVNRAVNGARNSEHLYSAPLIGAVDFYIKGVPIIQVQKYCLSRWKASVGKGAPRGFVHLGIRGREDRRIIWDY